MDNNLTTCNTNWSACLASLTTCNAGTAAAGDVLSGRTFSSSSGLQVTGTMPNNGAVTLTPGTADQAIAAGYHNGLGKCAGDGDLQAGNIKSGINIFGVTGTLACGNGSIDADEQCDQSNLNGETCVTQGFTGGMLACGAGCVFDTSGCTSTPHRLIDNGDGTVTDTQTGLMWEKKTGTVGGAQDLSDPHNVNNRYTWSVGGTAGATSTPTPTGTRTETPASTETPTAAPEGTVFTQFLEGVNGRLCASSACPKLGGHSDWRLPLLAELQTIVEPVGCRTGPACIDSAFGPTAPDLYWSATTLAGFPNNAWSVNFFDGDSIPYYKTFDFAARAVRGGL